MIEDVGYKSILINENLIVFYNEGNLNKNDHYKVGVEYFGALYYNIFIFRGSQRWQQRSS